LEDFNRQKMEIDKQKKEMLLSFEKEKQSKLL